MHSLRQCARTLEVTKDCSQGNIGVGATVRTDQGRKMSCAAVPQETAMVLLLTCELKRRRNQTGTMHCVLRRQPNCVLVGAHSAPTPMFPLGTILGNFGVVRAHCGGVHWTIAKLCRRYAPRWQLSHHARGWFGRFAITYEAEDATSAPWWPSRNISLRFRERAGTMSVRPKSTATSVRSIGVAPTSLGSPHPRPL